MDPKNEDACDSKDQTTETSSSIQPGIEVKKPNGSPDDVADSKGWLPKILLNTGSLPLPEKVEKYALEYKMDHASRGVAIIFNNKKFSHRLNLNERRGTDVDCQQVQQTLRHLGFEKKNIKVCNDATVGQMRKEIKDISFGDHTHCDCLVVVVLSHGDLGYIYGIDGKLTANELWEPFMANKCPSLAGKPKLFFLQACQGDRLDHGHVVTDVADGPVQYKIPTHADFLIAYSTVPGFYSWRNTTDGSWFIQSLCSVLLQYGHTEDLATILTFVNQKVAVGFESNVPTNFSMHAKKQIPCHMSMLTRKVYFKPKDSANSIPMDI